MEIVDRSSRRTQLVRGVYIVMLITVVLAVISCKNSFTNSWVESRITLHQNMIRWFDYIDCNDSPALNFYQTVTPSLANNGKNTPDSVKIELYDEFSHAFESSSKIIPCDIPTFAMHHADSLDMFNCAKKIYYERAYNRTILEGVLLDLRSQRQENVLKIDLPVFNISIDINDLGIVSSIAFSIILFSLIYVTFLKLKALELIKAIVNSKTCPMELKDVVCRIVELDQVLSVRGHGELDKVIAKYLGLFPKMLLLTPISVHVLIIVHDLMTLEVGLMLHPWATIISLVIGFIGLLVNSLFTAGVWTLTGKVNDTLTDINHPATIYPKS